MLSYRHSFHAGNFADVLKHIILIQLIEHLKKKDKAFCYIDTHAGAGKYALHSDYALKNREFDTGISKLWQHNDAPSPVTDYLNLIKQFNPDGQLTYYPGSPLIAKQLLREKDPLFLYELHTTEATLLSERFKRVKNAKVFHANGLIDSLAQLPPSQRRGLIMIDPSYEMKQDYRQVVESLVKMTKRFATGTYALWYPVTERKRCDQLERSLIATGIKNMQLFELALQADSSDYGMTACGMIIINPPWTLTAQMQTVLPYLATSLSDNHAGFYRLKILAPE